MSRMRKRHSLITILMALSLALQPVSFAHPQVAWAEEPFDAQNEAEVFNAEGSVLPAEETGEIAGAAEEESLSAGPAGGVEDAIPAAEIPYEDPDKNEDSDNYEVVADTEPYDGENEDQAAPDAGSAEGDGSYDLLLIDGLIEEAESETEGGDVAPAMEELPLEDPDIAPDDVVTKTSGMPDLLAGGDGLEIMTLKTRRSASAAPGAVVFSGSYGDQLSGFARRLYDLKAAHYVTKRSTAYWNPKFTASGNPCTFEAVCRKDASGNKSYVNNDASMAAKESLKFAMQSSSDAFKHDYPQTFWFRVPGTYSFGFKSDDWEEGETRTFYLQQILYKQVESFNGAYGLLNEVEDGVDRAAGQVLERASAEAGGAPSKEQVLREILDYVDARAVYDYSALSDAESISAAEKPGSKEVHDVFRIYTCAGLFTDSVSNGVVCEGYAKAVKVLCDREDINIPCVILCGANHMWNAVQLDGTWYLLDATWCDTSSDYRYFLTYDAHHQEITSSNFSGSDSTTLFTTPVLSSVCFNTAHNYSDNGMHKCTYCSAQLGEAWQVMEETSASCTRRASRVFEDGAGGTVTVYTKQSDPEAHEYTASTVIAPTCTHSGYTLYVCACGAKEMRDQTEPIPHTYSTKKQVAAPTCTHSGYTLYACSGGCGAEEKRDYTPLLPHTYTETAVEATASSEGYTQHTCTACGFSYKDGFTPKLLSGKPVLKKIKLSGKRTLKLTWKKAGSYEKYEVQYALSPDFSDAVTRIFKVKASDGKTITRKIRVKKDRRYYVRARAVSGDRVSAWSNVRKKKTKK